MINYAHDPPRMEIENYVGCNRMLYCMNIKYFENTTEKASFSCILSHAFDFHVVYNNTLPHLIIMLTCITSYCISDVGHISTEFVSGRL